MEVYQTIKTVVIDRRFLLDWGDDTDCQEACIHGIKLRWFCEVCEEEFVKCVKKK